MAAEAEDISVPKPAAPATAPPRAAAAKVAAAIRPQQKIRLQFKTTITLLTLLIAAVGSCGAVFYTITRSILHDALREQISQLAYGLSGTMGDCFHQPADVVAHYLAQQDKTAGLDFVALTDNNQHWVGSYHTSETSWSQYQHYIEHTKSSFASHVGTLSEFFDDGLGTVVLVVPVYEQNKTNTKLGMFNNQRIVGYLHVGLGAAPMYARLRYLHAYVLITCMAIVLSVIPLAALASRHVVVPIQTLANAARAFASGDLAHRVGVRRRDEIGDLATAFNGMADTVQAQQEDIRQINAGLEAKVLLRTSELEKLNQRLRAEIDEKEDFLRAVSHDLNAPLRNISGMAAMLVMKYRESLEEDALQRLERIQKNVEVECELINELLELSRIKTRREKTEIVDLHELLQSAAEQFSNDFETRGISLKTTSHLPVMRCEKSRMRQVFQNLIDNAVKYMRPESAKEITVNIEQKGDEMHLTFSDTGMGIAAEDIPNMFRVFRRAKNAAMMKIPGKGVGLASVKSIIDNYGGRLWVESQVGIGTCFTIALPAACFEPLSQGVAA